MECEPASNFYDDIPGDARERVLDLSNFVPLLLVEGDRYTAGTDEAIVRIKPSDGLLMLSAALGAGDFHRLITEN